MADDTDRITAFHGGLGPWQVLLSGLLASSNFFLALNTIGSAFVLPGQLSFFCAGDNSTDQCSLRQRGQCETLIFDRSSYRSTAIEDFALVCDRRWMASLAQSLAMAGLALGALAFGQLADRSGRRTSLLAGAAVHSFGCLVALAAPGVEVYALSRLLISVGAASAAALDVLLVESLAAKHRCLDSLSISLGFCIGALSATGLSLALCNWRILHAVMLLYGALVFSCATLVHESPRWLFSRHRPEDAQEALRRIALLNGVPRGKLEAFLPALVQHYEDTTAVGQELPAATLRQLFFSSRSLGFYTLFMWFQASIRRATYCYYFWQNISLHFTQSIRCSH